MKQILKGGDEYDCTSKWRNRGWLGKRAGVWKRIKRKMNKRFRKRGKVDVREV
ncbi:MAG: hypothetical protein GY794_16210 [bacterium]|nr:hypothetical protein [bacterium]